MPFYVDPTACHKRESLRKTAQHTESIIEKRRREACLYKAEDATWLHRPLSIWSGMFVSVHLAHGRHVSATTLGGRMRRTRSSPVTNCIRKPADECQAMWQWKGQTPEGESARGSRDDMCVCVLTWVVSGVELDHQVPLLAYLHHVPALRVVRVDNGAVPVAVALLQDVHVEAV